MDLTDAQGAVLELLIPKQPPREDGKGRPRCTNREVLAGILWALRTGAAWRDLPDRYPSAATCRRRFREWRQEETPEKIRQAPAKDLQERGDLDRSKGFPDGFFVVATKGGGPLERPSGAKVRRPWRRQTAMVFLSPSTLRLLRRMKSPLWKQRSPLDLCWKLRNGGSVIEPTIATRWMSC